MTIKREIVLTGFDVWHTVDYNSAWETVTNFNVDLAQDWEIKKVKVPVSWEKAFESVVKHLSDQTELVVCLGMARHANSVLLEQYANNRVNQGLSDVDQRCHNAEVVYHDAPARYQSPFPVAALSGLLKQKNIPAQVSYDAGDYLCNHLFYSLLHHVTLTQRDIWVGFVHVPPYEESGGLSRVILLEAVNTLMNGLVAERGARSL